MNNITLKMNRIIILALLLSTSVIVSSCGGKKLSPENMSIDDLKSEVRKKNQEVRELSLELEELQGLLEAKDPSFKKDVFNVTIDTLLRSSFEHYATVQGQVRSNKEIMVSAETGGRVLSLRVKEGDYVRKGTVVATMDIESVDAQISEIESQYALARDLYEKQKTLWDQEIGSEVQYLQAKNNKENLEKRLATLRINQSKANVYATASGTVEQIMAEEGEFAGIGSPIISLVDGNDLKVVAMVPEVYVKNVKLGNEVKIEFPLLDTFQIATIGRVGTVINPSNRTIEVEMQIAMDKDKFIKPNMLTMVHIKDFEKDEVFTLPTQLVQQEVSSRKYVLVAHRAEGAYVAVKKYVKTGPYYNNRVLIEEGLEAGDLIINSGARGMATGSHLNILTQEQAANLLSHSGMKDNN